ncbi:hypothetical protein [Kineococcus sp. SYSU DK003]|uniref:hypothetical protein n=1 Tax=Kineococcus sp. SYSU DK003 TaxID=3383124 RepID=UPI003D7F1776
MASPEERQRFLKFALSEMGTQNAHHEFEHLCRHLATRRVASNILPATGPVSSGGDQARDFETFRTYLAEGVDGTSGFLALATSEVVAFACTLHKDHLSTKIRSDVRGICTQGTAVDVVCYFTSGSVPVAARHRLQEQAKADHRVRLEIFDAEAITTWLADPELYWIANAYLHLPMEMAPAPQPEEVALPRWYQTARIHWRTESSADLTSADFFEIRRAARHAASEEAARPDLPQWLRLLHALALEASRTRDRQNARYELALATYRGTGDLTRADDAVRDFMADVMQEESAGLLMDAAVLLAYCLGARLRDRSGIPGTQIHAWGRDLLQHLRDLLELAPPRNQRAALLEVFARLALTPVPSDPEDLIEQDLPSLAEVTSMVRQAQENGTPIPVTVVGDVVMLDADGGLEALSELTALLPLASTFPVEGLCNWFDFISQNIIDDPRYRGIRDALDAATGRVAGNDAVATRCMTRARALVEAGRLLPALNEFHEAKVTWWSGDTLRSSLLAMLSISDIYTELRLPMAAKQYAMAVAFAGHATQNEDVQDLIPVGLFGAANCDHAAGAWIGATELTRVAMLAQHHFMLDPWNNEKYLYLDGAWDNQAIRLHTAQAIRPAVLEQLRGIVVDTPVIDSMPPQSTDPDHPSEDEWAELADQQLSGRPFDDAGPQRVIHWAGLGTRWYVRCPNDRATVLAAERFSAAAQILLADLSAHDPLLLPSDINISLTVRSTEDVPPPRPGQDACVEEPDNAVSRWTVSLTPYTGGVADGALEQETLAVLAQILVTITLLPGEAFMTLVERSFERGLLHKLGAGRPYDEVADTRPATSYTTSATLPVTSVAADRPRNLMAADELPSPSGPGPGYTEQESLAACAGRYENLPPIIRFTLARMLGNEHARQVLAERRRAGWLDWHLLTAIANVVGNQRLHAAGLDRFSQDETWRRRAGQLMRRAEEPNDVVSLEVFTSENLSTALNMSALHTLTNWGLQTHQRTPDFAAILTLLGDRYGYWTDDVPHDDLFGVFKNPEGRWGRKR